MSSRSGLLLVPGKSACELVPGRVDFEGGLITAIELQRKHPNPGSLPIIAPGLIDLHVHGFGGFGPLDNMPGMARALAQAGTTAFQPTLFPASPINLGQAASQATRAAIASAAINGHGARFLGLHLEGPFVNPLAAGALPPSDLAEPNPTALAAILQSAAQIRTLTIAPELPGASDLAAELARCGIRASFGHSTATAAQARATARAAPFGVTHLFNAMSGVHHRDPGLASLALTDEAGVVEIIGDLVHVGPEAIDLALKARGPAGLALVSDALAGAGTGCDVFHSHGRDHVIKAGAAYYPATDHEPERLAGSATGQLDAITRLVASRVVNLAEALTMATLAPARALDLAHELGSLHVGAKADLISLDPSGLSLTEVLIGGTQITG